MSELIQLDEQLFHLINSGMSNPFFDAIMPYWRSKYLWIPLYVFIISFLLINFKKAGLFVMMGLFLTIGVSDFVSSNVIKKTVKRVRPCNTELLTADMELRVHCGGGYSFTSSHATNHFALATFLTIVLGAFFKWIRIPLFLWAGSIAFGQIYVGVHYPLDVFIGAIVGILLGFITTKFYQMTRFNQLPQYFTEAA